MGGCFWGRQEVGTYWFSEGIAGGDVTFGRYWRRRGIGEENYCDTRDWYAAYHVHLADVKSAVTSSAEPWMSILKSERAERDSIRLDRDQYRMRVEPQTYMRQKEAELDHLLKIKEIEMEKKLRRLFYAGTSRGRTSDKRSPIVTSTPRQTTSTPDDGSSATRSHSNTREIQKPRQPTTTTPEDASSVEMRKPSTARQPTTATYGDASSVEMRKPGIPRQPTTTTPEDASSVEMRKPIIPEQLTTSNREEASSVEMRKPDTRTYISSRDIRTPVAAMSVTPDGVMVEPPEDLPSSDDSRSSDNMRLICLMRPRPDHQISALLRSCCSSHFVEPGYRSNGHVLLNVLSPFRWYNQFHVKTYSREDIIQLCLPRGYLTYTPGTQSWYSHQ